jgi:putative membrane protein
MAFGLSPAFISMPALLISMVPARQLLVRLLVALPLLASCSSGSNGNDVVDAANAQNQHKIDNADVTAKQEADAKFLVNTASSTLLEIELGKLAQARATTPAVRTYGTALLQSRLEMLAALRTLADAKKLALPPALGEDEQAAYHEVSSSPAPQLDKRLVALLVKTQKQDEDAFDDMSDDAYDGDIRGFAAKYLEPVRENLEGAKDVAEAVEKLP